MTLGEYAAAADWPPPRSEAAATGMSDPEPQPSASFLVQTLHAFRDRPRMVSAIATGLIVSALLWSVPNDLRPSTRAIIGWDATALTFITLMLLMMADCGISKIQARAKNQDEGRGLVLALSSLAAAASVLAIGIELSLAKEDHGLVRALRVGLAFATIGASWFFAHLIFALHYAHEYYSPDNSDGDGDGARGGLGFPGGEPPDYWDFLHFAMIIGVASQTADISFTSKPLRRIGTIHGVLSFAFNTVVLALTINLLAGLF
jgi:uncharacterized membrane protein